MAQCYKGQYLSWLGRFVLDLGEKPGEQCSSVTGWAQRLLLEAYKIWLDKVLPDLTTLRGRSDKTPFETPSHSPFHEILQYFTGKLNDKYHMSVVQNADGTADCKQCYCYFTYLQMYFEVDHCLTTCRSQCKLDNDSVGTNHSQSESLLPTGKISQHVC